MSFNIFECKELVEYPDYSTNLLTILIILQKILPNYMSGDIHSQNSPWKGTSLS